MLGQMSVDSVQLEDRLRERFKVREESFTHGALSLQMLLPEKAEDLLDEEAFERDECMPYWADLWPSAKGLAHWLLDHQDFNGSVIELGCGVALPSIALRATGVDVLATDYNDDALLFAQCNAGRNDIEPLRTMLLDWRKPPSSLGGFDLAFAADVLYEQRNAIALVDLLPNLISETGRFVLADPGRRWAGEFRQRMRAIHWIENELSVLEEGASRVRIAEWRPSRD
jgi:predicted nicotinamide N-methyase